MDLRGERLYLRMCSPPSNSYFKLKHFSTERPNYKLFLLLHSLVDISKLAHILSQKKNPHLDKIWQAFYCTQIVLPRGQHILPGYHICTSQGIICTSNELFTTLWWNWYFPHSVIYIHRCNLYFPLHATCTTCAVWPALPIATCTSRIVQLLLPSTTCTSQLPCGAMCTSRIVQHLVPWKHALLDFPCATICTFHHVQLCTPNVTCTPCMLQMYFKRVMYFSHGITYTPRVVGTTYTSQLPRGVTCTSCIV